MKQELDKTISAVKSAATAFQSIRWPSGPIETNLNSFMDKLSEITETVINCHYAVREAGSNARSTGWYVDEELWGAVQSTKWHAVADEADALEEQLDTLRNKTWKAHQAITQFDDANAEWEMSAGRFVSKIDYGADFDGLITKLERLSFLN